MKADSIESENINSRGYRIERISPVHYITAMTYFRPNEYEKKKSEENYEAEKSFDELFEESLQRLAEEEANQQPFQNEIEDVRRRR